MSAALERTTRHKAIREMMMLSKYSEAISAFKETIETCGPHIGLLCDYASCYYEMGQFSECWEILKRIHEEYKIAEPLLSEDTKKRTLIMLAKFYEEAAEPSMALSFYSQALSYCKSLDDKKWIYINELRLLSFFSKSAGLHSKYLVVTEMKDIVDNLKVETLHGLMWAEWALFGYQQALNRWQLCLKENLNQIDKRLLARDFLEISISAGHVNDEEQIYARSLLADVSPLDYDTSLISILDRESGKNLDELALSSMMKLRLLILQIHSSQNISTKIELRRKYLFLTSALSPESRSLFERIEPSFNVSMPVMVTLNLSSKKLSLMNGDKVKITSLQQKFLSSLSGNSSRNIDELSQSLWQLDGSESTYHRLRMLIYKLNDSLHPLLGFIPFEIKKDGAFINPSLQIEIK
ncbi:MAG: tetratricopeptide repeat protein [Bdellovibrio sp.]